MKSRKMTTQQKVRMGVEPIHWLDSLADVTVTYKSSNPRVASVLDLDDKSVEVVSHRPGKTTITARIKSHGKTIKVTRHTITVVRATSP